MFLLPSMNFLLGVVQTFALGYLVIELETTSLVDQMVKNPPAMWETQVRSPGWKDSLEKGMATHSRVLA